MPRYVMSHRRAGRFVLAEKVASRAAMERSLLQVESLAAANVLFDNAPADSTSRRIVVFEAEEADLAGIAASAGEDVLIEPELLRWPMTVVAPPEFRTLQAGGAAAPAPTGTGLTFEITARSGGQPLAHANVTLYFQGVGGGMTFAEGEADAAGRISFPHSPYWQPAAVVVTPYSGAWGTVVRGPSSPLVVACDPLPAAAFTPWWQAALRVDSAVGDRGAGIRVGVCDTGAGPHANLTHVVDAGAFVGGGIVLGGGADVDSHGTHVSGIIGARSPHVWLQGIAPGADLYVARVFPPGGGASQGDVAKAIDSLSKERACDLINLSLGSPDGSDIEKDAVTDAFERGTLAICAAGNDGGAVLYPASYEKAVAISALGRLGWGPANASANLNIPQSSARFGDESLYLASFSCFGPEIDSAGPGVGIISTVPERHGLAAPRAEMSGTSMASPAVCGALAVLLAADPTYSSLPRDSSRATAARSILRKACTEIGLAAEFEGYGVPRTS